MEREVLHHNEHVLMLQNRELAHHHIIHRDRERLAIVTGFAVMPQF